MSRTLYENGDEAVILEEGGTLRIRMAAESFADDREANDLLSDAVRYLAMVVTAARSRALHDARNAIDARRLERYARPLKSRRHELNRTAEAIGFDMAISCVQALIDSVEKDGGGLP
jgi:hypothetical protein